MESTQSLKESREAKLKALEALMLEADAQKSGYTADQNEGFDKLEGEVKELDEQITSSEKRDEAKKRIAEMQSRQAPAINTNPKRDTSQTLVERFDFSRAVLEAAEGKLTGANLEMHQEGQKRNKGLGSTGNLQIPMFDTVKRDLLADTSTAGAENIGVDVHNVIPFLYGKRLLPSLGAKVWRNLAADYKIPLNDATGSVAWEGEGDAGAEVTPTFSASTLVPKRIGGYINLSKQLLRQASNSPSMGQFATNNLSRLIDNAVETAAFLGGGSGEPSGIVDTLSATVSNTAPPTRADILALQTAVASANAEMGNIAYVTNPYIRQVLKTVDVGSDTGFFVWDGRYMDRANATFGEGMVEGYRAATTTLMGAGGTAGTNLNYVFFGNFEDLVIGQFGGVDLMVNPYTQAKSAKIEIIANMWVDVAILHNGSFGYNLHTL